MKALLLDGRVVQAGATVLDTCTREGVAVPALCHDRRLPARGHCRSCVVEVDGRMQAACTTPALAGMVLETNSARVLAYRRDLGELMLAEAQPGGVAASLLEAWGARGRRYRRGAGTRSPDACGTTGLAGGTCGNGADFRHPILRFDGEACIRCGLCVEACARIQGQFALAACGRGAETHISWGGGKFEDSTCVACGQCVAVCPSQALTDVDRERQAGRGDPSATAWPVRTTCSYCGVGCQIDVHVLGDGIVRIEGARSPVNDGHLCVKGRYSHSFARHPDRLAVPLVRRKGTLEPASWDEAIKTVAEGMMRLRGRVGGISSSRCTNEENYLLQKWMRAGLATNDIDCCARVCHAPSAVGMRRAFGTGAATNSFADIERADLVLVCGANPTESHPVLGARIKAAVLDGSARLVVLDPRRTEPAALADVHLQPRPGTNVVILNCLASVIVEEGLCDLDFVAERATGFEELRIFLQGFRPEQWADVTAVPASAVRRAARLYATARAPMQVHGLGITEHYQGSESVMLLCNLALLVGAVGREGVGVNPLRGQNNVQGAADMGCQPDSLPGYAPVESAQERTRFERLWQCSLPATPGRTLPAMLEAIDDGAIAGLFILGEDIVQTDPDSDRVRDRLARLELLVVQEIFLSETARMAHVVLPAGSAFEKDGTFTNAERRIQRVRRVLPPPGDARADWEILCALQRATGMDASYGRPADVFDEIRRAWPAVAGATYEALAEDGLQWPVPAGQRAGTPILHRDGFACGKAVLSRVPFLPSPTSVETDYPLTLVTGRVLDHYNSGSMTRRGPALDLCDRDYLDMHPADARTRGLGDGELAHVSSRFGATLAVVRIDANVLPGCAFLSFHFPDTGTNRLTSPVRDRLADCPEYKLTAIQVRPLSQSGDPLS